MPLVIPFGECVARPGEGGRPGQPLHEHLINVARAWEAGDGTRETLLTPLLTRSGGSDLTKSGSESNIPIPAAYGRLLFLGGLLHDAGKARTSWQRYIKRGRNVKAPRVFHAPVSAALYFYVSGKHLDMVDPPAPGGRGAAHRTHVSLLRAFVALDIADHHGDLSDLCETAPWDRGGFAPSQLDEMDLEGLFRFVYELCPGLRLDPAEVPRYLPPARDEWARISAVAAARLRSEINRSEDEYREAARHALRRRTSGLISADRLDAAGIPRVAMTPGLAAKAMGSLEERLKLMAAKALAGGASKRLVEERKRARIEALEAYTQNPTGGIYQLVLPTGLGKTMTGLSVALTACSRGKADRIVYVAPYIAILSQAAGEIEDATGLDVMQHHHLSVLEDGEIAEDEHYLTMESWQAPVVATTFNQLFLALFPKKAQHTLRLGALHRAFIVVDEPQIIESSVWKLFLRMAEALVGEAEAQVLFTTATMPPTENGLAQPAIDLQPGMLGVPSRYEVLWDETPFGIESLVEEILPLVSDKTSVAVVMNTIKNSAGVYGLLLKRQSRDRDVRFHYLSGAMTALHKSHVIRCIRRDLSCHRGVVVVSTQVLEAGVDLSFTHVFRELPVIPCIVQVAGRANRHGEQTDLSSVRVFRFLGDTGREPRDLIYRSTIWRQETDKLLEATRGQWREDRTPEILGRFYSACYARAPDEALLQWLVDAASGTWSSLLNVRPFDEQDKPIDIFVPWGDCIPQNLRRTMRSFGAETPEQIWELYMEPGFVAHLSFLDRKRFIAVIQHFTVPATWRTARSIADPGDSPAFWRIIDRQMYDDQVGLAKAGVSDVSYLSV